MKRVLTIQGGVCLILLLASSCYTMRKKTNSGEQHQFAFAHTALASDSAVRYWYFASDSAFAYHPDSGLRTVSGRLLGWESSVSHKLEQHTLDSNSSWKQNETEVRRNSGNIWLIGYTFLVSVGVIFVIVFLAHYKFYIEKFVK